MPKYVVVTRIIVRPQPLSGLTGYSPTERVPGTWHLAEVADNGKLSVAHACGAPTAQVEVRHSVREWGVLEPWCPECEARAGDAARGQAALEAAAS
jgi:hypothetical protein